jgi:small-conductance mechanosensitive channel
MAARSGRGNPATGFSALLRTVLAWVVLLGLMQECAAAPEPAASPPAPAQEPVPLVLGNRSIHVFRSALGAFTPAERAEGARLRILKAFELPGEGWTSLKRQDEAVLIELDGKAMFLVLPGDVPKLSEDTVDSLANATAHALQIAWREAREIRDPHATLVAGLWVLAALAALVLALTAVWMVTRRLRDAVTSRLAARVQVLPDALLASRLWPVFLGLVSRSVVLAACVLSLLAVFIFLTYGLNQFAYTRAIGEGLFHAFSGLLLQSLATAASTLPGLFVAMTIFLVAWVCTQVSSESFKQVAAGQLRLGMLDAHTAPATRRIVNASLWLFALAMAYPYLPGAQTEAFKGLSVILGLMVSIGASGLIGQIASGLILVYTRALSLGEYVRIQDCEGTVTDIGLFVTRLRTGLGVEYALPNAVVVGNVTRNLSRDTAHAGYTVETGITIGYDTPWRQVHALLIDSTQHFAEIAREPAPYVVQTALSDSYVVYRLVVCATASDPAARALLTSRLHASILDIFNRYGVQIMSPNYYDDPARPKIVDEAHWYEAPARRPDNSPTPQGK